MSNHTQPLRGMESLEDRRLMAADVMASPEVSLVESAKDPMIISAVYLDVGDQRVTVTKRNDVIAFKPGQHLQVVGIDFEVMSVDGSGVPSETGDGVIAFEGYLRHTAKSKSLDKFDYDDGRFAAVDSAIATGSFSQPGLQGDAWALEEDTNRLALALLHYTESGSYVEDRFHINLQSAEVDLGLVASSYARKGDSVRFFADIQNKGDEVTSYAEIDVYRADDLTTPIWVGTYEGKFDSKREMTIEFTNRDKASEFDKHWEPQESGVYVVRIYLDPENSILEGNENNNFLEGKIDVRV